jgi:hypothetical protein
MKDHPLVLCVTACLAFSASIHVANADEVYKWTDANGQVHFGDRRSAPSNGQKVDVKSQPAPEQRRAQPAPAPSQSQQAQSKPADASQAPPGCQDLIDQISKVQPGTNWQSLYRQFNASCPGIAYVCNNYRTHPENNKCEWVRRTGNNILQTNNYE